jgi:hypothetical protein
MTFVSPQFLWALGALSIPVIIHLFNFRRTVRVQFSNTRFLKQVRQETTQHRNLKRYLILVTRLLFLFFLIVAFAQPFVPAKETMSTDKTTLFYLDNSFSMSGQVAEKTRALDAGAGFIREIVDLFPSDTRYKLLTNDFAPFSNSYKTKTEILDLLAQLRLSPISRTFEEISKRFSAESGRADIFWISDFQKSTWGRSIPLRDSVNSWHLIPLSLGKAANVFVDTLFLENPFVIGGERNVVKVRLRNAGPRKIDGLVVKLMINDIQSATASAVLEPNQFAEVDFAITAGLKTLNAGSLSFHDFPINFDNEFYFALNFTQKIRVVEVKASRSSTYIEKVFGNNKFFYFRSFQEANVNYSALNLADLVVVNGIDKLDPALAAALQGRLANFGTMLFIPGRQPDVTSYANILPQTTLKAEEGGELEELEQPDFKSPFFENVFEDKSIRLTMPKARQTLSWGSDRSAILKFRDGRPFLTQRRKTFVMASPMEEGFTDFFNQALFVPVMYRIAASGKKEETRPYFTPADNLVTVQADSLPGEDPLRLVGRQEIIPAQRKLGDNVLLEIPRFAISPGIYRVMHRRDTLDLVAFNLDKRESLLSQYTGEEIRSMLGSGKNVSLFEASSGRAFSNEIKERYLGTPLWKEALLLALFFLLAEVLLIRFFN